MKFLSLLLAALIPLAALAGAPAVGAGTPGRFFFKTYGPEQGLGDPALAALAQDEDGFIWIASDNGLIRYDGSRFRKWGLADGLPSATVLNVISIPGGGLWIATEKGVARFQEGRATPLLFENRPLSVGGSLMQTDAHGTLWLLTPEGLYRQRGPMEMERLPLKLQGVPRAMTLGAPGGPVFLATSEGLWEYRPDGRMDRLPGAQGLDAPFVESMAMDGTGRLWVASARSLHYREPGGGGFHDVSSWMPAAPFQEGIVRSGPDGIVGLPTHAGLLRLRGNFHEFLDASRGLPCKWTASSLRDREGNLWVVGPHLYRMLGRSHLWNYTSQDGLPSDLVWCTFRDRHGRLWAGTAEGVAWLGPKGWVKVGGTEGLSVTALVMDGQDRLWIGANKHVLRCLEPGATVASDRRFTQLRWESGRRPDTLPDRSASLILDPDGILWMGDPSHGIYRIDPRAGTIRLELPLPRMDMGLRQLVLDREDRLCVATRSGLLRKEAQGWRRYGRAEGLRDDGILDAVPVEDGSCWIVYQEALGVDRIAWEDGRVRILESRNAGRGLSSDRVYSMGVDGRRGLWVGTDHGVDRLREGATLHLGVGEGMAGEDCSSGGMRIEPGGDVWVGTSTGLVHIAGVLEGGLQEPMKVFIQQIQLGRRTLAPPFPELPALSHRDPALAFQFACPTYVNERSIHYEVRLLGLEEEWHATEVPEVRYPRLAPGDYQLEVRAALQGQPFGPVTPCRVTVLGPWWASIGFLLPLALGGAGLVALFMDWRLRILANQKRKLSELVERRTAELRKANLALEHANLALKAQSLADPLTHLYNRRFLTMVVEDDQAAAIRAYRSASGEPLANRDLVFFMVDLDHFKQVNDLHGHGVGDRVLSLTAAALNQASRENDAVIRWGGEEFLIMARHSSRAEAQQMAERICGLVSSLELALDIGETLRWTCSVGFAALPFQVEDPAWLGWEQVVEIADACLYVAKRSGRNAWVGAMGRPGLQRAHGTRLPWELMQLRAEGLVELVASRPELLKGKPSPGGLFS